MIDLLHPTREELRHFLHRASAESFRGYPIAEGALPPRTVADASLRLPLADVRGYRWTAPFLILLDGVVVGSIGGKGLLEDEEEVELGYNVAPAYRRRGIATAAVGHCVATMRSEGIWPLAHVEPQNLPSRRVLHRNGFVVEVMVRLPDSLDLERWRLPDQYQPPLAGLGVAL